MDEKTSNSTTESKLTIFNCSNETAETSHTEREAEVNNLLGTGLTMLAKSKKVCLE